MTALPVDCGMVPGNTTIDCAHPWADGCTSKLHFEFPSIWNFTQRIHERCPTDTRLFKAANGTSLPALTRDACEHIAGSKFNYYQSSVSWKRLTTWKFPLLQLLATFPRPPLGYLSQFFVMAHLLGDPIDTIKNLLLKLSKCQSRAKMWRSRKELFVEQDSSEDWRVQFEDHLPQSLDQQLEQDRRWKALALLSDAYDEWGKGDDSVEVIKSLLESVPVEHKTSLMELILEIAEALAADRQTKYLPIVVALSFFIGLVVIALIRTKNAVVSDSCETAISLNVEVHGIAFSALFFWVIPTVFLGSVIGVSQTEERIRRILERFHRDLEPKFEELAKEQASLESFVGNNWDRIFNGGLYSWRPLHWYCESARELDTVDYHPVNGTQDSPSNPASDGIQNPGPAPYHMAPPQPSIPAPSSRHRPNYFQKWWKDQKVAPYLIVLIPTLAGTLTSGRVPPDGWNCRVIGEVFGIFIPWLISAQLDFIFDQLISKSTERRRKLFWKIPWWEHEKRTCLFTVIYIKDVAVTLATITFTLFTILGCLNKCSCWMSDTTGLILPQSPDIDEILRRRLNVDYPAFIFSGVAIELLGVPFCVWLKYPDALRVFVQRDDGKSNWKWYWKVVRKMSDWQRRLGRGKKYLKKTLTVEPRDPRGANASGTELLTVVLVTDDQGRGSQQSRIGN